MDGLYDSKSASSVYEYNRSRLTLSGVADCSLVIDMDTVGGIVVKSMLTAPLMIEPVDLLKRSVVVIVVDAVSRAFSIRLTTALALVPRVRP